MATYGPMYMESATVGWVAASDGIYRLDIGVLTKRYTNTNNWIITGIGRFSSSLVISVSNSNDLYSIDPTSVTVVDISTFAVISTTSTSPLRGVAGHSNKLYYVNSNNQLLVKDYNAAGAVSTLLTTSHTPIGMSSSTEGTTFYLYIHTASNVVKFNPLLSSSGSNPITLPISSPGRIAADGAGNVFIAGSGVKEYNASFLINSVNQCNQLSYSPIATIGFFGFDARAIDASGAVYSMTSSATALATGLPAPLTVDITTNNSIADITAVITPSFPNMVLPRWSNMIVLGAESVRISKLASATISRAEFDAILLRRYGSTTVTDAIRANCQFLPDTTVVVPIRR
jgi:hypothetical protein